MPRPSGRISAGGWVLAAVLVASSWATPATGEAGPPAVPLGLSAQALVQHADSGVPGRAEPAWNTVVGDPSAGWVRVFFGSETRLPPGARIRLTSLQDGAQQNLSAETLAQWRNSSAYFNGPEVLVELLPPPRGGGQRVVVVGLWAGISLHATESICFADDRILSSDARAARLLNLGCTGWLLNECFVTAGHCMVGNDLVEFNVPLSSATGVPIHPPPSDQYMVDTGSQQFFDPGGTVLGGNDWAYFGVFPNSETGLTPLQAQGAHYTLASNVPSVSFQSLRITGYGIDTGTRTETSQVQRTNAGPYHDFFDRTIIYQVDTTGGSSGSAVEEEGSQRVIGIHTNGGCTSSGGDNSGTAINHGDFQDALRNPLGVCASQAACNNNGVCDPGEDCFNCVNDCVYQSPAASCGDGTCNVADGEDCHNCPEDCNEATTGPPPRACCGEDVGCEDALCTGDGNVCSSVTVNGSGYCCGDGLCENAENDTNCSVDCGVCFATQEVMKLRIEPMSSFFRFSWDATSDPCLISYVLLGNNDPSSSVYDIVARSGPATFWVGNPLFSYFLVVVEDEVGSFGPLGHYGQ